MRDRREGAMFHDARSVESASRYTSVVFIALSLVVPWISWASYAEFPNICFYTEDPSTSCSPYGDAPPANTVCESKKSFDKRKEAVLYSWAFNTSNWPLPDFIDVDDIGREEYQYEPWKDVYEKTIPSQAIALMYYIDSNPSAIVNACDSRGCDFCYLGGVQDK
jgi:hypothetical protein